MSNPAVPRRRLRWWPAAAILVFAGATIAYLRLNDEKEENFRNMYLFQAVALTLVLLAVWLVFFSGIRWRTRLIWFAISVVFFVGLGVTLAMTVRIDGSFSGGGLPRLAWKWTRKKDTLLPKLPVGLTDQGQAKIDLSTTSPEDYPQFLGRDRQSVVHGIHLARDWSSQPPKELWRKPIGAGWSSFAIVGKHAVTQEQRDEKELVVCYSLLTGEVEWVHANAVRFSEGQGGDGPRATPTIADGRVYALGATGILDCLDGATGRPIWSRDTLQENHVPNLHWGKSSSPLVYDDLVVVSGGEAEGPTLLAYDKNTGAPKWQAGKDKASYSSPALAMVAGIRQILSDNANTVTAHDPADGHILWFYDFATNPANFPKASQPTAVPGDRVFVSAGYGAGCMLLQINKGSDGKLTATDVWKNRNLKSQFGSLVVRDGYLYGFDDTILVCLDLASGERKWKGGRYGHGQVLLVDDLLLVQAESGDVVLVEANPAEHRELGRIPALKSKTWNNPALAGRYLLVRNDEEAACYELPVVDSTQQ